MSQSLFSAKRVHLSCQHTINAGAAEVFPLLCPVREFDWIEKWESELIYSDTGLAELGCVFSTQSPHDGGKDIWVISRHDLNERVQFIRVDSIRSIRYDLTLTEDEGKTKILWQQEVTALNERGNTFVETVKQHEFDKQIKMLEELLNFYVENGRAKPM